MFSNIVLMLLIVQMVSGEAHQDWSRSLKVSSDPAGLKSTTGTTRRLNSSRANPVGLEEPAELRSLATQAQNTVAQLQRANLQLSSIAVDLKAISGTLNETLRPAEDLPTFPAPEIKVPLVDNTLVHTIVTLKNEMRAEMKEAVSVLANVLQSVKDDIVRAIVQQGTQISEKLTKVNCNCPNNDNHSQNYYRPPVPNLSSPQVASMHVY